MGNKKYWKTFSAMERNKQSFS